MTPLPMLVAATRQEIREACGDQPRWLCEQVLELTGNDRLSEIAGWTVGPLRIALILLIAVIVVHFARRAVHRALLRVAEAGIQRRLEGAAELETPTVTAEQRIVRAGQRVEAISSALQSALAFVVFLIAVFLILAELGISLAPLIAGAGVIGLALGFGAQSLVKDFLSGIFILIEDQYAVGDIVDLGEATGTVENVSLRTTRLRSVDGVVWHIANGEILRVGNMSQHWSRSLLDIEVAYDTDIPTAKRIIQEVADSYAEAEDHVIGEPSVWGVEALGANGVTIRLVVKTKPSAQWRINRDLRERIKEAFDQAGIEIPFPQQTVWYRAEGDAGSAPQPQRPQREEPDR